MLHNVALAKHVSVCTVQFFIAASFILHRAPFLVHAVVFLCIVCFSAQIEQIFSYVLYVLFIIGICICLRFEQPVQMFTVKLCRTRVD